MHLIRPVSAGPVLTEEDLKDYQISEEQERAIRLVLGTAESVPTKFQELPEQIREQQAGLEKLYESLEQYEETLVPKGYHPVNKEPLHGE